MKTILSAVRGWVVMGVILGSGGVVWGDIRKVETPNGCGFNMDIFYDPPTIFKTEGKCINNIATGSWIFGIKLPRATDTLESVFARTFVDGNAIGMNMNLARNRGRIILVDPAFTNGTTYLGEDGVLRSLAEINQMIDRAAIVAKEKNLPVANITKYKELAMRWHKDRNAFVDQWIGSTATFQPENSQSNSRDDPKVFGRGARGG